MGRGAFVDDFDSVDTSAPAMSFDPSATHDQKVAAVRNLYRALAAGDRETLGNLLHPDFVGHATEGLPLGVGGEHGGSDPMRREVWWQLGRHYNVEAQPDAFHTLDDGRLLVAGYYRGEA